MLQIDLLSILRFEFLLYIVARNVLRADAWSRWHVSPSAVWILKQVDLEEPLVPANSKRDSVTNTWQHTWQVINIKLTTWCVIMVLFVLWSEKLTRGVTEERCSVFRSITLPVKAWQRKIKEFHLHVGNAIKWTSGNMSNDSSNLMVRSHIGSSRKDAPQPDVYRSCISYTTQVRSRLYNCMLGAETNAG